MKNNNRLSIRLLSLLMTFVMLFSFSSTVLAASVEIEDAKTEYYTMRYESDAGIPKFVLTMNADKFGQFVNDRNFTKAELMKFLPDIFAKALANKSFPSVKELLNFFPDEFLTVTEIQKILPEKYYNEFLNAAFVLEVVPADKLADILPSDMVVDRASVNLLFMLYPAVMVELLNEDAIKALADTNEKVIAFVNKGVIAQTAVEGLLSTEEMAAVEALAGEERLAKAVDFAMNNHDNELIALLQANRKGVADASEIPELIAAVGGFKKVFDSILRNCDAAFVQTFLQKVVDGKKVDFNKVLAVADADKLKKELIDFMTVLLLRDIKSISLLSSTNGTPLSTVVYEVDDNDMNTWKINDLLDAVANSIPTEATLSGLQDGDTVYDVEILFTFNDVADVTGFGFTFNVAGDTALVNQYADKIFKMIDYSFDGVDDIRVSIVDGGEAPVVFARALNKLLATDKLDDAKKAEILSLFSLSGIEFVAALKALDLSAAAAFISADYITYINTARNAVVSVMEKLLAAKPELSDTLSFATMYQGNGAFAVNTTLPNVPSDDLIDKLCNVLGLDPANFKLAFGYDKEIVGSTIDLKLGMADVYRVRYYDANDNYLYTTFLPVGADLSLINDNVDILKGLATEGWKDKATGDVVTTMPAADIDLTAAVAKKVYTATFVADGKEIAKVEFVEGATFLDPTKIPAVPSKVGYTGKWAPYVLGNADITIEANYTAIVYTATFIADGRIVEKVGFTIEDVKKGELPNIPRVPNKDGYYGRWDGYTLSLNNLTVKAIYTNKTYTVNFDANGGEGQMPVQILVFDEFKNLFANQFVREGYEFASWNTKADGTGFSYADKALVKNLTKIAGITLYAQWNAIAPDTHTVTFMANGVVIDKVTFAEGATELERVPAVPTREGYTGAWEAYTLGTSDITVNANYTAKGYTIVYDANGGEGTMADQDMTYDTFLALTANKFTYEGYTFAGWNTAADGSGTSYADGENVKNLATSGEVTLYAQWDAEETTTETTTAQTTTSTTTAPVEPDDDGFNWIVLVIVIAVLAVIGGVVGFLVYKKKKA